MSKYYPVDALRHCSPLVLVSGLDIPQDDQQSHLYNWAQHTTRCSTTDSTISQHPFLRNSATPVDASAPFPNPSCGLGERIIGSTEPNVSSAPEVTRELFNKLASKSSAFQIWNPTAYDVSKKSAPYLLNIQFTASRSDFVLPPAKSGSLLSTAFNASSSFLEKSGTGSDQASIATSNNSIDEKRSIQARQNKHTLLSPLNSASDLYPDGLISEQWIQKYLLLTPCSFISVLSIDTTVTSKEDQQTADAALTKNINDLKAQLLTRNIKLTVILVSNVSPTDDSSLNDRIYYLRKNTGLAARTGLFFLPPPRTAGNIEIETLAEALSQLAYSNALDFYSGIAKRINKRIRHISTGNSDKTKSVLLDDTLTVTPLSHAAWDVRYQYKLAVMAEFRQDLEGAIKGYETTYEAAMEVFEVMHPLTETCTSQRWQEFRAFMDLIVYKIVKLYFYMGQGNHAYKKYQLHIYSVDTVLKQKRFDLESYQVTIWKASLEKLVADLLYMTQGMLIEPNCPVAMHANPMVPGDNLPRTGYWYLNSATNLLDLVKSKPSNSIQEKVTDSKYLNDSYFEDYNPEYLVGEAKKMLDRLFDDFSCDTVVSEHSIAAASYQLGEAYFLSGQYSEAYQHYKDATRMYRLESWSPLLRVVLQQMAKTAEKLGNTEEQLLLELELSVNTGCKFYTSNANENTTRSDDVFELSKLLKSLKISDTSDTYIKLHEKTHSLKFYNASFAFYSRECFLGLSTELQLTLNSVLPQNWYSDESKTGLFTLQQVVIKIKGELGSIRIKHNPNLEPNAVIKIDSADLKAFRFTEDDGPVPTSRSNSIVNINDDDPQSAQNTASPTEQDEKAKDVYKTLVYECEANLSFKPDEMRVFQVAQIPKALGEARFIEVSAITKQNGLTFDMTMLSQKDISGMIPWYFERELPPANNTLSSSFFAKMNGFQNNRISANHVRNVNPHRLKLLPRPSLISVSIDTRNPIASDEQVRKSIGIFNAEQENVIASIKVQAATDKGDAATIQWLSKAKGKFEQVGDFISDIELKPQESISKTLEFFVPSTGTSISNITVSFAVSYHPIGNKSFDKSKQSETSEDLMVIKDTVKSKFDVLKPFAVYSDVHPRVHPDPWPSMFDPDVDENLALFPNIWKRWELNNVLQCTIGADSQDCVEVVKTELDICAAADDSATTAISNPQGQPKSNDLKKEADIMCKVVSKLDCQKKVLLHNQNERFSFIFDAARKTNERDIRGGKLEAMVKIYWKRVPKTQLTEGKSAGLSDENDIINVYRAPTIYPTILLIEPRLIVTLKRSKGFLLNQHSGSSPTATAVSSASSSIHSRALKVTYYIENSTAHMLTYSVTMGPSDIFAFQGPKQLTVRMLPFSRRAIQYIMYPVVPINNKSSQNANSSVQSGSGSTLTLPQLRVYDVFYKRILQQATASKWLKNDKGRLLLVL